MYLVLGQMDMKLLRFPHAGGDVPYTTLFYIFRIQFSPRGWGCTGIVRAADPDAEVFPTRVGMYRRLCIYTLSRQCFPHAGGDVPPGQ